MLKLKNICKTYVAGTSRVHALDDVSISFRRNEFVAVLGQSGCGKTTLLNIVGGLDRYTSGDLVIAGKSTKSFTDKSWDSYRNHSVGFVFQSYNLIPHQTALANVELALTLSGVSKAERRKRAAEALEKVGLGNQLKKKPNQMSGGQMQRVAIARALVNDPEIILADEPTGALDSATSLQVMEILRSISKDKLIVMVTHNPDLAALFSTRTIQLRDGKVVGDSMPFSEEEEDAETRMVIAEREAVAAKKKQKKRKDKTSMSFKTAFLLSLNNLMTKKGRTFLTSFAGSIGIIGIALIMSLSNGINLYINKVQEDTLSTYPLTIESETMDMTSLMNAMMGARKGGDHELDAVYSSPVLMKMMSAMNSGLKQNNLTQLKAYLEDDETGIKDYILDMRYDYNIALNVYAADTSNGIVKVNPSQLVNDMYAAVGLTGNDLSSSLVTEMYGLNVWTEMLENDELLTSQYDIVAGRMPASYEEIVVVVDEHNEISDLTLYTLGLLDSNELKELLNAFMTSAVTGVKVETSSEAQVRRFDFDELLDLRYKVMLATDYFGKRDGVWTNMNDDEEFMKTAIANGIELKVVGVIRPNENASATSIGGSIGYTHALVEKIIEGINSSAIVTEQMANPEVDVLTGLAFAIDAENEITIADFDAYVNSLSGEKRVEYELYYVLRGQKDFSEIAEFLDALDNESKTPYMLILTAAGKANDPDMQAYLASLDEDSRAQMQLMVTMLGSFTDDKMLEYIADDEDFTAYLEGIGKIASTATYSSNLSLFGYTTNDSPSSISIYAKDFDSKEKITAAIDAFNADRDETEKITYSDYIGVMLSSVSTIVNFISYALIAFVSISLVVSSIMIGIITYISVLERTKEIGILRSIGASKRDISRVFNAETLIIGLAAGVIGILCTLLLILPINLILAALAGVNNIAVMPLDGAMILIAISMLLTILSGSIPSHLAAKKDPVIALRTE